MGWQLEILKLREEARLKLGSNFDRRAFHDELLGNGALPLDVLDSEVESWLALQKKQAASRSALQSQTSTPVVSLGGTVN
jgi:hypothetical protein